MTVWRVTLHRRPYAFATDYRATIIAELTDARGRRLDRLWNQPAQFVFTLDGYSPNAALVTELAHEVIAWRDNVAMFRGPITQSQDQIDENTATVTFTAHDYLALLKRRYLTVSYVVAHRDQDFIVADLIYDAMHAHASAGASFYPASWLPLVIHQAHPDGSARSPSGVLRDRTYEASQEIGQAFDDLANVAGGYDYDLTPLGQDHAEDLLNVYYPAQGVERADMALVWGSTVSTLTRTVDSGSYGNYWRILGNKASSVPTAPQLFSERYSPAANNVTTDPQGLWMSTDNASDVTIQATLDEKAAGDLKLYGVLLPAYTLGLTAGAYQLGSPNMCDVVPLVIKAGRLNVNSFVRVIGLTWDIGDDGQEDVAVAVGRPDAKFSDLFAHADRSIDALARR
jgi:hypothetical protein